MRTTNTLLSLSTCLLFACGGSTTTASSPTPADAPAASGSAAPSASPVSSAEADSPAKKPDASAKPSADRAAKPPFGGEDPGVKNAIAGSDAWVYWPEYGLGLMSFKAMDGTKAVFYEFADHEKTFSVPSAFAHAATEASVKKGDLVLATIVTNGKCARVTDVKGDQAKVSYLWGDKLDSRDFATKELLRLEGKLGFGAPVVRKKSDGEWSYGFLVHSDAKNAWLASDDAFPEDKAPLAEVSAIDVQKARKKGEIVIACSFSGCSRSKIGAAKYDGLAYEILPADGESSGGSPEIVDACHIGTAPKK